jgi:hypothetical protein
MVLNILTRQHSTESVKSKLSVPPKNDPVISKAAQKIAASSVYNVPIEKREQENHPFRHWVSTLHKRSSKRRHSVIPREERWSLDEFDGASPNSPKRQRQYESGHRKSQSWASDSSAAVAVTRSAMASLTTLNEDPESPCTKEDTSDGFSSSFDTMDSRLKDRATKRRHTIDEIVASEVEYIADLKALLNVSFSYVNLY